MTARSFIPAAGLLALLALQGCSAGRSTGEALGWESHGETNGFTVTALLTDNFPGLMKEWYASRSPRLKTVGRAKLGGSLNVAFLVAGCRPGYDGQCNITAEVMVKNEAGDVVARSRVDDVCPDQKARPPKEFMLCGRTPAVDNNGRPEKLEFSARVRDELSGRAVNVKLSAEFS